LKSFRKTLMEAAAAILISNCAFIAKAQAPEEDELQGLDLSQQRGRIRSRSGSYGRGTREVGEGELPRMEQLKIANCPAAITARYNSRRFNLQFSFCNFQFSMQSFRSPPRHVLQFESESHHLRGEQRFCHLQICRCWPI